MALDEPFERDALRAISADAFMAFIAEQFRRQRSMIESSGEALSTKGESSLINHYARSPSLSGIRRRQVDLGRIRVKPATKEFMLVLKHTIPFTAFVEELMDEYRIYALVRNPLAILASWNTIDSAYREGRIQPYAASLTRDLVKRLARFEHTLDRQIALLDWHFEQYRPLLHSGAVVRYEDIIQTGGGALGVVADSARRIRQSLTNHNSNQVYDRDLMQELKKKLLVTRGAIWDFYEPASIEQLLYETKSPA